MRAGRLEVEEKLRIDLRELLRTPGAGEEAACERRTLAAVVPAPKGAHERRALQVRAPLDAELVAHRSILLGRQSAITSAAVAAQSVAASVTWPGTSHHGS